MLPINGDLVELRQLEYVLAAIDHGGFTPAAEALHVAQPTLSQGIRTLEVELGVQLFDRVGRGVRLSSAGQAFEAPARRALQEAANARLAATEVVALTSGHVTIISLPTLVVEPLVRWVGRFRQAYPGVTVNVIEAEEADEVPAAVRQGRADLGLAELQGATEGLDTETVIEQELMAICPPGTDLGEIVSLRRLVTLPIIATPIGTSTRRLVDQAFADVGRPPDIAVEVGQREAILPLVLAGAGISFVPRRTAERAQAEGAVAARTRPRLRRRVGLIRRSGTTNPAVAAFLEATQDPRTA